MTQFSSNSSGAMVSKVLKKMCEVSRGKVAWMQEQLGYSVALRNTQDIFVYIQAEAKLVLSISHFNSQAEQVHE